MRKDVILLNIPEFLFLILLYCAILMKIIHLPIANLAYTIFSFTLSFIYMVWGAILFSGLGTKEIFGMKKQKGELIRILFGVAGGLAMSVYTIFFWAWILRLHVLGVFMLIGVGMLLVLSLVAVILIMRDKNFFKTFARLMLSVVLVTVPHLLFSFIRPSFGIHH